MLSNVRADRTADTHQLVQVPAAGAVYERVRALVIHLVVIELIDRAARVFQRHKPWRLRLQQIEDEGAQLVHNPTTAVKVAELVVRVQAAKACRRLGCPLRCEYALEGCFRL